ncbi:MAG: hypothetical protein JXB49_15190 [Bacteroidales bacterium]|nr:hypothetical protein [Bacteroidales bacterium]
MKDDVNIFELLIKSAAEYGKTSYELVKLKAIDKISDIVSSFIPHSVVLFLIVLFMLFLNIGIAFWLGEIFGSTFYGFFALAAFYGLVIIILHFFMHKWLKRKIYNFIIKQVLK